MATIGTQEALEKQPTSTTDLDRRRRIEDLCLVCIVAFLPLVVSSVSQWLAPINVAPGAANQHFVSGLAYEFAALVLFLALLGRQGRGLRSIGLSFQWSDLGIGILLGLLCGLLTSVAHYTWQSAYYFWNREYFHYRDFSLLYSGASTGLFLVYICAAPWFEELLVRGYLMTELRAISSPVWLTVAASVLLQTSYHLYYGFAGAMLLSLSFAVLAIYFAVTRRLMPVIFAHFVLDLIGFLRR